MGAYPTAHGRRGQPPEYSGGGVRGLLIASPPCNGTGSAVGSTPISPRGFRTNQATSQRCSPRTPHIPSGRSRRCGREARRSFGDGQERRRRNGWSVEHCLPAEQVPDPDVRADVTLQHVPGTATEHDPARRRSLHTGHASRGIQEHHGDRKRHADRVNRATGLQQHHLVHAERPPTHPSPPLSRSVRRVHLPSCTTWADDRKPSHPANVVACTDTDSWAVSLRCSPRHATKSRPST